MAENYRIGTQRMAYRATKFQTGLDVKVDVLLPSGEVQKDIELTEWGEGIYFFDYEFKQRGLHVGIFYENGKKALSQNFVVGKRSKAYYPKLLNTWYD